MTFEDCCLECIKTKEFVEQFNRLTGHKMGANRTPMEKAIDSSCGHNPDEEAMPDFVKFVFNFIWLPLVSQYQQTDAV